MALKLVQSGNQPLGQFDGLDSEVLTLKGGEVVTFKSVAAAMATDKAAADVFDGYVYADKRAVVTKNLSARDCPLMLADDGIAGYGTLFGSVVGGTVGTVSTGGAVLGPHTATASGKVTCWEKPGVYAVSLDACDTNATTGLQPTNPTLDTGDGLYATLGSGLLTPDSSGSNILVGRFIEFQTSGSLVTTPNRLVATLNPPDGKATDPTKSYSWALFYFNPSV